MSLLQNPSVVGVACFIGGAAIGYWLWRWKERSVYAALAIKEQSILESARRQAESITREAHLQSEEEALRLRQQTETGFLTRRTDLEASEKRLNEREALINKQLHHIVEEEKHLRSQQAMCEEKAATLEARQQDLAALAVSVAPNLHDSRT